MKDEQQLSQAVKLAQTASRLLIVVTIFAASIVAMSTIRSCNDCPPCAPVRVRGDGALSGSAERAP